MGRREPPSTRLVEEVVRSSRRDPRAEPSIAPPSSESPARDVAEPVPAPAPDALASAPPEPVPLAYAPTIPPSATMLDEHFAEVEILLGRNAWRELVALLEPSLKDGTLAPGLTLVLALAQREGGDAGAANANTLAIASMAGLLGVPTTSHTALMLAKRLLRQPPASWRTKPAPPARVTVPIVIAGLAVGLAAGWFASLGALGSIRWPF